MYENIFLNYIFERPQKKLFVISKKKDDGKKRYFGSIMYSKCYLSAKGYLSKILLCNLQFIFVVTPNFSVQWKKKR